MRRAVKRDAVKKEKFYFRKTIIPGGHYCMVSVATLYTCEGNETDCGSPAQQEYEEMDIDTIMNGKVKLACHDVRCTNILAGWLLPWDYPFDEKVCE